MTPLLRPASLSDRWSKKKLSNMYNNGTQAAKAAALRRLYDAEWRLRGFERSP